MLDKLKSETELRRWLAANINPKVSIQWVEPGKYGSTEGASDAILSIGKINIFLELKFWKHTKSGICCKMRPVQRRWHHVSTRAGKRTAILAYIENIEWLMLVRGDHVPIREYASHPESGCPNGQLIRTEVTEFNINSLLFDESRGFWI